MKRSLFLLVSALMVLTVLFALTGCGPEKSCEHVYDYDGEYSADDTYHWYDCKNGCGATDQKRKHTFGDVVVTEEATCTEEGVGTKTCITCDYEKEVKIPVIAHSYKDTYEFDETNHWRQCANCTATIGVTAHSFTSRGHDPENHWFTCACGAKGNVEAHDWNEVDNGDGTLTLTCKDATCNTSVTVKDPNHKHNWVDGEVIKNPSCTETGERQVICSCGSTSTKSIDKTKHSFTNGEYQKNDTHHWRNCVCGAQPEEADKVAHDFSSDVVIEGAYKVKHCVCGQEVREPIQEGGYIDPEGWT